MKKFIAFTLSFFIFSFVSMKAQTDISILTGLNISKTSNDVVSTELFNLNSLSNWNVGILMDRRLDKDLLVRTGLVYKRKGFEISESTSVNVFGLDLPLGISVINQVNYLELPLQLMYEANTAGIRPYITAGPSLSYAMSASVQTRATALIDFSISDSDLSLSSNDYNRWDIALNAQSGVKIPYGSGHFIAEIGYSHGLNDFTSDSFIIDTGLKNRSWTFNVGYGLRF